MNATSDGSSLVIEDHDGDRIRLSLLTYDRGCTMAVHAFSSADNDVISVHLTAEDARAAAAHLLKLAAEPEQPAATAVDPIAVVERLKFARRLAQAGFGDEYSALLDYLLTG